MADDANDIGDADLYGITLEPLQVFRITADKRISSMDATTTQVVVAAADQLVDKLGFVNQDGTIAAIPGLGRPFAYTPSLLTDGSLVFADAIERDGNEINRLIRWDPERRTRKVVVRSREDVGTPAAGPRGSLAYLEVRSDGGDQVLILGGSGAAKIELPEKTGGLLGGGTLFAGSVEGGRTRDGFDPTGLQLIDSRSGKVRIIAGWDPIAWSPDGRTLLVRDTGDLVNSRLALLHPDNPDKPRVLGTLPQLTLYTGAWVRNNP